ncbi:hypothetical protein BCR44DRAFT_27212 [Catenaria anguillulae PL171]|uniref:Ankyrin repeat-containing domain protein n=1 Tax=Catenaria anguillulae PL171 TaxID=765915 RepID=A0A1Y2HPW8_9FUNG|nr:hypothetical protein BCR44DRAFT_27212 [Catenaria anguillulae PL171]
MLLDEVSAKGFVNVLDWWHNSSGDNVIGQTNPIQRACDGGHPQVLSWWWSHQHRGRLGERFPGYKHDLFSLMEATRKGDMAILQWWFDNVFADDMEIMETHNAGAFRRQAIFMANSFQELIMAAGMFGLKEAVDFWVRVAEGYCGLDDSVMSALFACGRMDWIDEYLFDFDQSYDSADAIHPCSFSAFSGNIQFIEACLGRFSLSPDDYEAVKFDMTVFASCMGQVHVLDWMHSRGMVDFEVLTCDELTTFNYKDDFQLLLSNFKPTTEPYHVQQDLTDTLIHWLVYFGDLAVLEWWHRHNSSDFEALMTRSEWPLFPSSLKSAIRQGHAHVVRFLFAHWRPSVLTQTDSSYLEEAALRGHVDVFTTWGEAWGSKWHGPIHEGCINAIMFSALSQGHVEIVEWWMSTWPEAKFSAGLGNLILHYLKVGVPPKVLDWCLKNAHRFRWEGVIEYNLNPAYLTAKLSTKDTLRLISFNGQQCGQARFEPMVDDNRSLLNAWRGQPLALQSLVTSGLLSERFDLDVAILADAGVAVYDWMLGFRRQGRCRWTVRLGYGTLVGRGKWNELTWWAKKGLPVPPYKSKEDPWEKVELDFDAPLELDGEDFAPEVQ